MLYRSFPPFALFYCIVRQFGIRLIFKQSRDIIYYVRTPRRGVLMKNVSAKRADIINYVPTGVVFLYRTRVIIIRPFRRKPSK